MKHILIVLSILAAASLGACNTMAGAGEDIKAGGQGISTAADKDKNY